MWTKIILCLLIMVNYLLLNCLIGTQMSFDTSYAHKWLIFQAHLMNRGKLGSSGWIFFRHWT
ncbi:hypothetical protein Hanom_Chr02g00140541 [Helianthus anomalus]